MARTLALLALAAAGSAAEPPFLHPLFSDHAVLQRERPLPVWGWSAAGERVSVTLAGRSAEAVAGPDGRWQVLLPALPAGGPYELVASAGARQARVADLLVGEVWLCSGQSNMEWNVQNSDGWAEERVAAKSLATVRQFRVAKTYTTTPAATCAGRWKVAADGPGQFTAVGYYFARELERELGVPVGVVNAAWGGTTVEAWTSLPALTKVAGAEPALAKQKEWDDVKLAAARAAWWAEADPDQGQARADHDDAAWRTFKVPGTWKPQGVVQDGGIAWLRRTVELPAAAAGAAGRLGLGITVDSDTTYLNGVEVGKGEGWEDARSYAIPAGLLKAGANTIAIRLRAGGDGGIYGEPAALVLEAGGARVPLAGPWRFRGGADKAALAKLPRDPGAHLAGSLWNAMIAPLTPASVRGVAWYQGETNAGMGSAYAGYLTGLIAGWRAGFAREDLPFGVVQLAGFGKRSEAPVSEGPFTLLREAQARVVRSTPNTGLAVAIDVGNPDDVHPRAKREVGRRLAAWALHDVYGRSAVVPSGPVFTGLAAEGATLRLAFDHAQGLTAKGELKGFAIAGTDGPWLAAEARIDGATVVVSHPQLAKPAKVRYAWGGTPDCPLYNGAGLPAVPFRSDAP
ncbi:MAG: 9-O-acetylesterase [Planctomycetes bacterium]|nr:9-O-acetylesterase [Planctomycetota bacterium]